MGGEDVPGERARDPGDLLPLTPVVLNVLLALADGERHGYGIMLEVRERTGGRVRLGPGTLYGAIKRLKEGGVIEESGQRPEPGEAPRRAAPLLSPHRLRRRGPGSGGREARRPGARRAPEGCLPRAEA